MNSTVYRRSATTAGGHGQGIPTSSGYSRTPLGTAAGTVPGTSTGVGPATIAASSDRPSQNGSQRSPSLDLDRNQTAVIHKDEGGWNGPQRTTDKCE